MPWWGWLILACVVIVVAAWLTAVVLMQRAWKRESEEFDRKWRNGPFGTRR